MSEMPREQAGPVSLPKEDPETLVLRARPRPVVRFRRGLIVGISAAVMASLAVVTWLALEPRSFRLAGEGDGAAELPAGGVPDALAAAPRGYGEVPQLGPPLPGDLGRPILEHQRSLEDAAPQPPAVSEAEQRRAAIEAERQRELAARDAARASGVMVQLGGGTAAASGRGATAAEPPVQQSGEDASPAAGAGESVNPGRLRPAPSPWTLTAGTVIPASLITGLNSDLPGTVLAHVTENVRDSATGRTILIPQGARLIGSYDSLVAYGQRRALLVWQRIVLPDGSSMALDNMPATDLAGYSGVEDGVDFHTWRLLKGIGLSTLLGVGTEIGLGDSEGDLVRAIRESAQQNAASAGDRITQRNLDVEPTLTVRPGWPVRAIVHKDLVLRPWRA